MSSYSASIATANGNLTVTRPLSGGTAVDSIVDDVIYAVRGSDTIQAVSLSIVTTDSPADAAPTTAQPDSSTGGASDPLAGKTAAKTAGQ